MAIDLRAVIRLDDRFTRPADRIRRDMERAARTAGQWRDANGRLRDSLGRFVSDADRASRASDRFSRSASGGKSGFSGALRGLSSLTAAIGGVAAAYAGVRGAKTIFENTVGAAAKYEQSSAVIGAIINDKKKAADYLKLVDDFSVNSPVMNSQDMMANSKSFLTATKEKNMGDLREMWSLAERMAAIDPMQGVEGAVFALREMFSGDAISMVRRFEMPKSVMNTIKKLDVKDQLVELDKYFNSIGMTQKLIDEMGNTTLGIWARVNEQFQIIFRDMGEPALKPISKFLTGIIDSLERAKELDGKLVFNDVTGQKEIFKSDITKYQEIGKNIITNVVKGMTSSAKKIYGWFTALTASEEYKKRTTFSSKVVFVFDDILKRFSDWMKSEGEQKLTTVTKTVMEILAGGMIAAQEPIVTTATTIGKAIGKSLVSGISDELENFALTKLDNSILSKFGAGKVVKEGVHLGYDFYNWVQTWGDDKPEKKPKSNKVPNNQSIKGGYSLSHNGGLSRVPYDGYIARLHKDERVLTAQQAKEGNGTTVTFGNIILNGVGGDLEKAADKILDIISTKIEMAGGAGA